MERGNSMRHVGGPPPGDSSRTSGNMWRVAAPLSLLAAYFGGKYGQNREQVSSLILWVRAPCRLALHMLPDMQGVVVLDATSRTHYLYTQRRKYYRRPRRGWSWPIIVSRTAAPGLACARPR